MALHNKLQTIDFQILYQLDINCRAPVKQIAEALGTYPGHVQRRIKRMERLGVLRGYSVIINTNKLGYFIQNLYIKYDAMTDEGEAELLQFLQKNDMVTFVLSLFGRYDIMVTVKSTSLENFEEFFKELRNRFGELIVEPVFVFNLVSYFMPKKYFLREMPESVPLIESVGIQRDNKATDFELKIMRELKKDSRKNLADVAHALGATTKTVRKHLADLETRGVIKKYLPLIEIQELGYTWYLCLVRLRKSDQSIMDNLLKFVHGHPNLVFMSEGRGKWDLMIDIHCESTHQCKKIIRQIKQQLVDDWDELEVSEVQDRLKHQFIV